MASAKRSGVGLACALGAALGAAAVGLLPVAAQGVVVYGGPELDTDTQVGFYSLTPPYLPGSTAGNGVGVGIAEKRIGGGATAGQRPFRWDSSGTVTELGLLGANSIGFTSGWVYAINASGTAVGYSRTYEGDTWTGSLAVRWDASSSTPIPLGHLGLNEIDGAGAAAVAINDAGTIAGSATKYIDTDSKGSRAVRWDAGQTTATELGHLGTNGDGTTSSSVYAINSAGTIVGYANVYDGNTSKGPRAVRWDAGQTEATLLEPLSLRDDGSGDSMAMAVNDAGTVAGYSMTYEGSEFTGARAVRWEADQTTPTQLGDLGANLSGYTDSRAYAINASGTAVGYALKYDGDTPLGVRAVRWDAGQTTATELGLLGTSASGSTSTSAYAINAAGFAVGYAESYDDSGLGQGARAAAWDLSGAVIDLNTLLGPEDAGWVLTRAYAISDTFWITGIGRYTPPGGGSYDRMFLLDARSLFVTSLPEPAGLAVLVLAAPMLLRRRA